MKPQQNKRTALCGETYCTMKCKLLCSIAAINVALMYSAKKISLKRDCAVPVQDSECRAENLIKVNNLFHLINIKR